jgi:hypothetical protein
LLATLSPGASNEEEPMSTTLTIPANVLPDVRESLFCLLGDAAEAISHPLEQPGHEYHPEWFDAGRRQLGQVFALLDLIGWDAARAPRQIHVDLHEHRQTLQQALDGYKPVLEDQEREADANDQHRRKEGKPPRKQEIIARLVALREFIELVERRLAD